VTHPAPSGSPSFLDALRAMRDLLEVFTQRDDIIGSNPRPWLSAINEDIEHWRQDRSVAHHLSLYGGMGSFNDLGCKDGWLGTLFDQLKSTCFYLAIHPSAHVDPDELLGAIGTTSSNLTGWRCASCGYATVTLNNIDFFEANDYFRHQLPLEAKAGHLQAFVRQFLSGDASPDPRTRPTTLKVLGNTDIRVRDSSGWMRPCPSCQSNDTRVCQWRLEQVSETFVLMNDSERLASQLPLAQPGRAADF
jgi:hypothetical protein